LRVRSLARTVRRGRFQRRVRERFLAAAVQLRTGYLQVTLSSEGRQRRHYVHRLMREAFDDLIGSVLAATVVRRARKHLLSCGYIGARYWN
jgi:hypothetical protein